jgi:hypothetical protein
MINFSNIPFHPLDVIRTRNMAEAQRQQAALSDEEFQARFGVNREEFFRAPQTPFLSRQPASTPSSNESATNPVSNDSPTRPVSNDSPTSPTSYDSVTLSSEPRNDVAQDLDRFRQMRNQLRRGPRG